MSILLPSIPLCIDIITIYVVHRCFLNKICLNQDGAMAWP